MADLHILCRMCTVEGGTPGGRCLRSGHKNSVKGKGAIKHKGAPTIIYHCTDAPLPSRSARHPPPKWGWARKTWRRGAINPKPCLPLLAGGGGPRLYLKSCLPPLAGGWEPRSQNLASPRSRGEGDHEVVEGGCSKRSMPAKRA